MLKKTFIVMLAAIAVLPFAGQLSAADTQDVKNTDTAWFWGRGCSGCYGGYYPYSGYGYGYGYYPYSYGYGCNYGCGCGYGCY